jgi:hypothetical protein
VGKYLQASAQGDDLPGALQTSPTRRNNRRRLAANVEDYNLQYLIMQKKEVGKN